MGRREPTDAERRRMEAEWREQSERERADLDRRREELHEKRVSLERKTGELRGQLMGIFDGLRQDADVLDALRTKAWFEHKPDTARKLATYDRVNDRIVGLPQNWPKGVNAREYVDTYLDAQRDKRLVLFDEVRSFDAAMDGTDPELEDSASIRALRRVVELGPNAPPSR